MNFRDDRPTLLEPQTRRAAFQGMRHPATRRRRASRAVIPVVHWRGGGPSSPIRIYQP